MSYNTKNIDDLFNILNKDAATIIRNFASIGSLLTTIFNDDYFVKEAADELLQKLSELIDNSAKSPDDLLKIAINIIFYEKLFNYVTGIKFSHINYHVNSIFAAICYQLHLSRKKPEMFLQEAETNAFALMRKINEIKVIETLKIICHAHLNKLAKLKTSVEDINPRINMLKTMLKTLQPDPDENPNEATIRPVEFLQNRINTFKEQFIQYRKKILSCKEDPKIHEADRNFIAKIKRVFSALYVSIVGFFSKERNIYEDFTIKVEKSIALTS